MKRLPMRRRITPAILLAGLAISPLANATNGILPLGNGMTAHGLGGAGIANAGDAMAGTDNPALLADTGDQMSLGASIFSPLRSADLGNGYVDSDSNYFLIPQFAWTKTAGEKMNWGILVTAMGGMNTDYPKELMGAKAGIDLSGLIIAPSLSFKSAGGAAIGFSALLGYERFKTTLPKHDPNAAIDTPPSGSYDKSDSATGTGLKLGLAFPFDDGSAFGAFYQSRISMGEMSAHCDDQDGMLYGIKHGLMVDCALNLAPMWGAGFKVAVSEQSKIVMDLIHVAWTDVALFEGGFDWRDQNILKIGFEHKVNDGYVWRIGYNYARSPVKDESLYFPGGSQPNPNAPGPLGDPRFQDAAPGVMAPAVSERHFTFGFSKKMGNGELVGYYAYVPEVEQTDLTGPGGYDQTGTFQGFGKVSVKMSQHALGIGYNWK